MTQKTTTCTTPSPVEAFALHLRSQGYALISLPGGVKLRNINTGTDHSLDSLAVHYARFQGTHGIHYGSPLYFEHFHTLPKVSSIRRCRLAFLTMGCLTHFANSPVTSLQ